MEDVRRDIPRREYVQGQRQDRLQTPAEQTPIDPARRQRHESQPSHRHYGIVHPVSHRGLHGRQQAADHVGDGQPARHVRRVDGGEGEPVAAQLAVLLARVAHPLHQALLVDPLDAARADAGVEEGAVRDALRTTDPERRVGA